MKSRRQTPTREQRQASDYVGPAHIFQVESKKTSETTDDGLMVTEIEKVFGSLTKQMQAKKKVYFRYKRIVTDVLEVPDHDTQRAAVELMKIMGLYPRG